MAQASTNKTGNELERLDELTARISFCDSLDGLFATVLPALQQLFDFSHSMLLLASSPGDNLYVIDSRGYGHTGIGAEIAPGLGVIGHAAHRLQVVRLNDLAPGLDSRLPGSAATTSSDRHVQLPALEAPQAHVAVPLLDRDRLLGVLAVESPDSAITEADEAILNVTTRQFALSLALLRARALDVPVITTSLTGTLITSGLATVVKRYASDNSVFIANQFVAKGITGALLWRMLNAYQSRHTGNDAVSPLPTPVDFDTVVDLVTLGDQLESRLVLLSRRLRDCCEFIQLASSGASRFHLGVSREIALLDVAD